MYSDVHVATACVVTWGVAITTGREFTPTAPLLLIPVIIKLDCISHQVLDDGSCQGIELDDSSTFILTTLNKMIVKPNSS